MCIYVCRNRRLNEGWGMHLIFSLNKKVFLCNNHDLYNSLADRPEPNSGPGMQVWISLVSFLLNWPQVAQITFLWCSWIRGKYIITLYIASFFSTINKHGLYSCYILFDYFLTPMGVQHETECMQVRFFSELSPASLCRPLTTVQTSLHVQPAPSTSPHRGLLIPPSYRKVNKHFICKYIKYVASNSMYFYTKFGTDKLSAWFIWLNSL